MRRLRRKRWTDAERKADVEEYLRKRREAKQKPKKKKPSKVARFLFGTPAERREAQRRWRAFKSTW